MSQLVEYRYKPQGQTLEEYILDTTQRCFIMGPLGSGKTNASCWKGFRIMCAQEPDAQGVRKSRGVAVRNTYPDLFGTTVKDWLDMFEHLGPFKQGGKEPPTHSLKFKLDDGTTVEAEMVFLALDREDHIKKLRGLQATFVWLNEVKELLFSIMSMVDLRVGRYPKDVRPTWYGVFGDTNACDSDHWYYRMAEEMTPEGYRFLRQPGGVVRQTPKHPWVENKGQFAPAIPGPAENVQNLPDGYYIKGAQGKTEAWIMVNLGNEYGYVGDGMPIYSDYVDSTHCRDFGGLVPGIALHIGLDFGLTPAAVIGQRMVSGQIRWRYEVVTTDTGVGRFAGILKRFIAANCAGFPIASITGDPAGDQRQAGDNEERTVFQLLEANQVIATPAFTNDFTIRTEAVSKPMRTMIDGEPAFLIHPDMRVTRKGCQGAYKFRRLKVAGDDRYENQPVKNAWSHPCEALQYGMMGLGEGEAVIQPNSAERAKDAAGYRNVRGLPALPAPDREAAAFRRKRGLR
ncbi:TerL [Ramlibacter sp.]|uniref:TerL n=1 Tax=Ramlibacter sp. TaxID=1917967 RepID=UPI003D126BD7